MGDRQHGKTSVGDIRLGARFLRRLPAFLRHPVTHRDALATLYRRLEVRGDDFLALVRESIYGQAGSPYRRLLDAAGCEYGDLARLVTQDGVEPALRVLCRHGVYLTVDEFKGRRPVVRGSTTISVNPQQLQNAKVRAHVPARSSGSRGPATPADVDLAFVRDLAVNHCLALTARGGISWHHAIWSVPGGAAMKRILWLAGFGAPPVRWFSPVDPAGQGLHPRYRWSAHAMRWLSVCAGVPLPRPVHVPLADPRPIVQWLTDVVAARGVPHLSTYASAAVRLCEAARDGGVSLGGTQFTLSGEPITEARLALVRRAGVTAVPQYGASEAGGTIGHGCLAPADADDIHLFHDLRAVIQPAGLTADADLPPSALLFSSLRSTAPFVLLNVSLGDSAILDRRTCGCPLERLGWTTHISGIRSYEKLTAGGIRLFDTDLIGILEHALPARFGGGPTDYQLVEDEGEDGLPRLRLVVDPTVGPLDAGALTDTFLAAIGAGSGAERVVGLLWRDSGFLRVERRRPEAGPGGKILHLVPHRGHAG
jgi:hypothetical protein